MAKIIFTSRYFRNPSKSNVGKLLRYIGTREGVEKLAKGVESKPATVRQQRLINDVVKNIPDTVSYIEYEDYKLNPTKGNATDFISAVIECNLDEADKSKHLVRYMAERPSVEKLGSHGLFSQSDDEIDLEKTADEVSNHQGVVWTHVVSLRREDAERLGYNNAKAWRDLARRSVSEIAEAHKIKLSNLRWYGAFHNMSHHPHIHLMVYSADPKEGWLSEKSIERMRSFFGNDIFRAERYKLFKMETQQRNIVKEAFRDLIDFYQHNRYNASPELTYLFSKLSVELKNVKGKKVYGYLPKDIKKTVDDIVRELAKDEVVAEMYGYWNEINREKLSLYYEKTEPDIPLEENIEFRSIKNDIIRSAIEMGAMESCNPTIETRKSFAGIVRALLQAISESYDKKDKKLSSQVDSKLKSKIAQKKLAHGLRTDFSEEQNSYDVSM